MDITYKFKIHDGSEQVETMTLSEAEQRRDFIVLMIGKPLLSRNDKARKIRSNYTAELAALHIAILNARSYK